MHNEVSGYSRNLTLRKKKNLKKSSKVKEQKQPKATQCWRPPGSGPAVSPEVTGCGLVSLQLALGCELPRL